MKEAERILCLVNIVLDSSDNFKKGIFKYCENEFIKFIGEVAINLLKENITVSEYYKFRLASDSSVIRSLGSRKVKQKYRRKLCIRNYNIVSRLLKACYDDIIAQLK
jgi:hypothetical protein